MTGRLFNSASLGLGPCAGTPLLWAQLDSKERTKRKRGHFRTQKGAPRTRRLVEIAIRLDGQGERAFD
jgi:hypothetical protein